jgi:diguanylate cyclase (GGDEF)-like protein
MTFTPAAVTCVERRVERRDTAMRDKRDAVATWLGVHPSEVAGLDPPMLDVIATRISQQTELRDGVARKRAAAPRREHLSRTDNLTGLFNRRHAEERLEAEVERARRSGRPLAVVIVDVQALKTVNDEHGDAAGDPLLRALGGRLERAVRRSDVVGRWGGDEFIVLCADTGHEAAQRVAGKLASLTSEAPFVLPGLHVAIRLSVGWAVLASDDDAAELSARAEQSLESSRPEPELAVPAAT